MKSDIPRSIIYSAMVAMVCIIGFVDWVTAYELRFFVFYYIPIAVVAWKGGAKPAYVLAILSTAVWFLADRIGGSPHARFFYQAWELTTHLIAYLVIAYGVARFRLGQEELRQHRENLFHLERVHTVGELAASLAHEINQPLTGILSNAQAAQRFLVSEKPNLEEIRGIMTDIVSDDKRITEIISRLRSLLKKEEPKRADVDVNDIVRNVLPLVRHAPIIRNVSLVAELREGLPPVRADHIQIEQVIINLIMNAGQAMATMSVQKREIVVSTMHRELDSVTISVRDSGPGIHEKDLTRVFDPFFTTKADGLGMGLSISRSIVQAHGGRVWAKNLSTGGALLCLSLPVSHAGRRQA